MEEGTLEEHKQALIDLIKWYRDEYHKKDFGHTEMMEEIAAITDAKDLEAYDRTTDMWLDH